MGGAIVQVDSQDIRYFLYSQYGSMHLDSYDGNEWHYETISESGYYFACAWLLLDEQDSPHIALSEWNYDDLMYGYKQGSDWVFEIVDDEDEIMSSKSLALDSNGYPHIAYEHENPSTSYSELKYAYKDTYGWHLQVVDDEYHSQGTRCRLDLDSQDRAHITYFKKETGEPGYISYAYWDGTGWQIEPIVLPHTSEFNSLTIDSLDRPHVAFLDDGYLRYAYKDGTDWVIEAVDICGGDMSIVLDSQEYPTIAYCDVNWFISYARWNGSEWEIEEACTGYEVLLGQLEVFHDLDSEDNPHITFDESPDVEAWYAWYGDPLTDITLDHFSAQAKGSAIAINWTVETTEGEEILGFNLYRRELPAEASSLGDVAHHGIKDDWIKINPDLITGQNPYTYTNSNVESGVAYEYKLEAVLADDRPETLGTTQATAGLPPVSFAILALYPNPASDYLTCLLALPSAGVVELTLYDLSGRLVLEKRLEATEPTELEAGLDVSGLASGVYTLQASGFGTTTEGRAIIAR